MIDHLNDRARSIIMMILSIKTQHYAADLLSVRAAVISAASGSA